MVQVSYPGVYIEEFAPAPPIQPASTNIAAFVGVAPMGEINKPTLVTSFNDFQQKFGKRPLNGFFMWYAVRGFFAEGGTMCYIVRATNGKYARGELKNGAASTPKTVFEVRLRQPGAAPADLTVSTARSHRLKSDTLRLFSRKLQATKSAGASNVISVTDRKAYLFVIGEQVVLGQNALRATILGIDKEKGDLTLDKTVSLDGDFDLVLADLDQSTDTIRLEYSNAGEPDKDLPLPTEALVAGAWLTIGIADDLTEGASGIVDNVDVRYHTPPQTKEGEAALPSRRTYVVRLRDTLSKKIALTGPLGVRSEEFDLTIKQGDVSSPPYQYLGTDPQHPRFAPNYLNARERLLLLEVPTIPPGGTATNALPADAPVPWAGGRDQDLGTLVSDATPFTDAFTTLEKILDVSLVAVPDAAAMTSPTLIQSVQQSLISHCELMGDRFALLDSYTADQKPFENNGDIPSVEAQRDTVESGRGYAGLYYPWLRVNPAGVGPLVSVPPSGHVAGLMARVDRLRGVHKAPANEILGTASGITTNLTNLEQGRLNLNNINVIRTLTEKGRPTVMGARTTTRDTNWNYVNVRRLFLFLERSLTISLRQSVFEPNNPSLWNKLNVAITAFLFQQWREGALFGNKAEEAFYVKIDESLNPFNEQALGKLTLEIGVRPTYPAEFIIVRIGIWDGGAKVSES